MAAFLAMLKKDLVLELRHKETLTLLCALSIILSFVVSVGVHNAFITPQTVAKLFPALIWIVSIFIATISIGRSFEYEIENSAYEMFMLSGCSVSLMYLAKLLSNFSIILFGHVLTILCLAVFLDYSLDYKFANLLALSFFVILGYAALGTLFSAITISSKLKSMLLPLLLLPLIFPLFFAAIELSYSLVGGAALSFESSWLLLLLALDLIYLSLGVLLFEHAVRE